MKNQIFCNHCGQPINSLLGDFNGSCYGCFLLRSNPLIPDNPTSKIPVKVKAKTPKISNSVRTPKRRCKRCGKEVRAEHKQLCYECRKQRGYIK